MVFAKWPSRRQGRQHSLLRRHLPPRVDAAQLPCHGETAKWQVEALCSSLWMNGLLEQGSLALRIARKTGILQPSLRLQERWPKLEGR